MTKATPRILVPLAHPIAVPELAQAAHKIATLVQGEIILLHVVPVPLNKSLDTAIMREAYALFDIARANLPPDARVRTEALAGHLVGDRIRKAALDLKADLILVGWRETFSLKSLVQGTLQPVLERPPCDVLLADLEVEDALTRIAELPGTAADEIGLRIIAAAAAANATGILLHDREPKSRAERTQLTRRHQRVTSFVAAHAPGVVIRTLVESTKRPLNAIAQRTLRSLLILVAPGSMEPPRVHPRPLARIERPLVALVG